MSKIQSSKKGWVVTKNGKVLDTPNRTKHGMLIGYDLMPLGGLRKCERNLRKSPYNIRRVIIKPTRRSKNAIYGAAVKGVIDLELAEFSVIDNCHERTMRTTAFFYQDIRLVTKEEYKILSSFYYLDRDGKNPEEPRDKRRRTTLVRLRNQTASILERLSVEILPVKYELA